jgi:ATP-dependent RNA helicase DHR2
MPERVHTKFEDEPLPSVATYAKEFQKIPIKTSQTNERAQSVESTETGHSHGVAQYLKELQKYSKNPSSTIERIQDQQLTQPVQSQGVKRSRDGSPKSANNAKSIHIPAPSEVEKENEVDTGEGSHVGDTVGKTEDTNGWIGKTETIKAKERFTVAPKTFYGSSQTSNHSSKRSASVDSTIPKGGFEIGITPQSTPRSSTVSRVIIGRKINGFRKSSVESDDSRGTSVGQRPSQQSLNRTKKNLLEVRKALPIWPHKADIRWALRHTDILLLVGETGSGKSTQVPQFLTSEPWFKKQVVKVKTSEGQKKQIRVGGMVAITEPRRVAATSLARRVAQETGSYLGKGQNYDDDQVGYSVRFDSEVPRNATIKFLTEGMLLQELLHDPYLRRYSVVIIDEIHERSVDVDLLTGFLRNIVRGDKSGRGGVPLKLVVMSATANMDGLQKFFSTETSAAAVSDLDNSSMPTHGDSQAKTNGTDQASQSHTDGINGIEKDDSNAPADRRASDASYSSWDGIVSDDEKTGRTKFGEASSSRSLADDERTPGKSGDGGSDKGPEFEHKDVVIHQIKGRQHPVKILYTPEPVVDYVEATLKTIFKIHTQEPLPGDILAFLTGQEEIETLQELVQQYAETLNKALPKLRVLCLYGHQSIEQQQEAFAGAGDKRTRKAVLATNIAETSITVPGVRFVIDCGKAKIKQHRARLGLQSLLVKPISKSSAIQRKGRAGREAPGKCYRLYTETEYLKLQEVDLPEILRSDVVEAVLRMKARGVQDVASFPLMDPPEVDAIERALLSLHSIGALNDYGDLNEIGKMMADFPLPPAYSRVLVAAATPEADCLLEAIDIIACLTAGEDIFLQPKSDETQEKVEDTRRGLLRREGDIITYLTTMQQYASENSNRSAWCEERLISVRDMKQAISIRKQLRDMCLKGQMLAEKPAPDPQPFEPVSAERAELLLKCFMKAFAMKTATLQPDGSYCTTIGRHLVAIHPSSVLHGRKLEAIMFLEHVFTQKNYAKKVSVIQMNWIAEVLEMP